MARMPRLPDTVRRASGRLLPALAAGALLQLVLAGAQAGERFVSASDLVRLKDIGGLHQGKMHASPDGKWIAFQLQVPDVSANSYRLTWYVLGTEGSGPPVELADGGELLLNPDKLYATNGGRLPTPAAWRGDSQGLFFVKRLHGRVQIWERELNGGEARQVTDGEADVIDMRLAADGTRLFHTVSRPLAEVEASIRREGERGYLFDDRFRPFSERWPTRRWCSDGWADAVSLERECKLDLRVYEPALRRSREALPAERDEAGAWGEGARLAETEMARASPSGDRSAWFEPRKRRSAADPGFRLRVSIAGAESDCADDACAGAAFSGPWWSADGRETYFLRRNPGDGTRSFLAWNPASGRVREIWSGDDLLSDCQVRGSSAFCLHESRDTPRKIVALSMVDGALRTLYDPNPEFGRLSFTRHRKLAWEDAYGNPVHGWLTYPRDHRPGMRYPLVVLPYDASGFLRGDVGDEYPGHLLAAEGFMVLSMSIPHDRMLGVEQEGTVREYDQLRAIQSAFTSLERILDRLDREGLIDPRRVGMTGLSYGAQQVHYALINSNRIAAASASGLVTPESWYYMESPHVRAHMRRWWGGAPSADLPNYRLNSYRFNVDGITAALLVNVSDEEFLASNQEFAALQDAGKPVEMYVFPGEHHIKWMPRHRLNIYRRNVQWFKFWLMGLEEEAPVDPDQYRRWRHLRDLAGKAAIPPKQAAPAGGRAPSGRR